MGIASSMCSSKAFFSIIFLERRDIRNVVHRHEPPVTSRPVKVLYQDFERQFIVVDKPGSIVRLLAHSRKSPKLNSDHDP